MRAVGSSTNDVKEDTGLFAHYTSLKVIQKEELVNDKVPKSIPSGNPNISPRMPSSSNFDCPSPMDTQKKLLNRPWFGDGYHESSYVDKIPSTDDLHDQNCHARCGDHLTSLDGRCDDLILKSGNLVTHLTSG